MPNSLKNIYDIYKLLVDYFSKINKKNKNERSLKKRKQVF